jgi:hypothetical protein
VSFQHCHSSFYTVAIIKTPINRPVVSRYYDGRQRSAIIVYTAEGFERVFDVRLAYGVRAVALELFMEKKVKCLLSNAQF